MPVNKNIIFLKMAEAAYLLVYKLILAKKVFRTTVLYTFMIEKKTT
jgi:hypothetical protein